MSHLDGKVLEITDKPKRKYVKRKNFKSADEDPDRNKVQKRSAYTDPIEEYLKGDHEFDIVIKWPMVSANQSSYCKICGVHATRGVGKERGIRKHIVQCHFNELLYKCPYCDIGLMYGRSKVGEHILTEHNADPRDVIVNLDAFELHVAEKAMECFGIRYFPQRAVINKNRNSLGVICPPQSHPLGSPGQSFINNCVTSPAPQLDTQINRSCSNPMDEFFLPTNGANDQQPLYNRLGSHQMHSQNNNSQGASNCQQGASFAANSYRNDVYYNPQNNINSENSSLTANCPTGQPGTSGLSNTVQHESSELVENSAEEDNVNSRSSSSQTSVCNDFMRFVDNNDATQYQEIADGLMRDRAESSKSNSIAGEPSSASSQISIGIDNFQGASSSHQSSQSYSNNTSILQTAHDNRVAQSPINVQMSGQTSISSRGQGEINYFPQIHPESSNNQRVQHEIQVRPISKQTNIGLNKTGPSAPSTPINQHSQRILYTQSSCRVLNTPESSTRTANSYPTMASRMEYVLPCERAASQSPDTSGHGVSSQQNLPMSQVTPIKQAHASYKNDRQTPMMQYPPPRPTLPNIILPQNQIPSNQMYSPITPNTPGMQGGAHHVNSETPNRFQFPLVGIPSMMTNAQMQYTQPQGYGQSGHPYGTPMNYRMPQAPPTPTTPIGSPYPFPAFIDNLNPTTVGYPQMNQNVYMPTPGFPNPNMNYGQLNGYYHHQYPQNPMSFPPNSGGFMNPHHF